MSATPWSAIPSKTDILDTDFLMLLVPTGGTPAEKNRTISGADAKIAFTPTIATSFTWAVSDEDSPLTTGIVYVTEAALKEKSLSDVILSLKNAPTNISGIEVDILKETGTNNNVFATIFSVKPTIDQNQFTSQTAVVGATFSDTTWQIERRLQIQLTINDGDFAASGLKVTLD